MQGHVARHLAEQCKLAIRDKRDPREYRRVFLERLRLGDGQNDAYAAAAKASSASGGMLSTLQSVWLWSELTNHYVAYKVANDLKPGRWAKQFARLFCDPAFDPLRDKRVCDVSHADLFGLKRAVVPAGAKAGSRAARIISQTIQMLDWALAEEPIHTGLLDRDPIWRALSVKYRAKERRRAPKPAEIARIILAVEQHAARGDCVVIASRTLQALLMFVCFTAQRIDAASKLKRNSILTHKGAAEWRIGHFQAELMKGKRDDTMDHSVPMPPVLVKKLEALWQDVDPDGLSDFAFPASRGKGPIAGTGLNALFRQMNGKAGDLRPAVKQYYDGKPGPKPRPKRERSDPDLFEAYLRPLKSHRDEPTYFTCHDTRRSITNFLKNRRLGSAASAILAHRMDDLDPGDFDEATRRERVARTTGRHYDTAQQIPLKTEALKLWSEALEEALESERAEVEAIGRSIV